MFLGKAVSMGGVCPLTSASVTMDMGAGTAQSPVPLVAGAPAVDTRVPVTMAPRVTRSQASARVPRAGEEPGVTRRVRETDMAAAVRRYASVKMVRTKYSPLS